MKKLITTLFLISAAAQAAVYDVPFGSFNAYTKDSKIARTLKTNNCARAAMMAMYEHVVIPDAEDRGADYPEEVEVSQLTIFGTGNTSVSITIGSGRRAISRIVETARVGRGCRATTEPYETGL